MSEDVGNKTEVKPLKDPITGLFQEGNPGGPGRPAGSRSFTTKVREALEKIAEGKDYTYEEAFIKSILKKGIVDGDSATQRLIWNYLDGMPQQRTDITSGGKVIPILGATTQNNGDIQIDNSIAEDSEAQKAS
jgi:hypothetical protein